MNPPSRVFPWQMDEWGQLARLHEQDRLPHALLLAGSSEIGKRAFALELAMLLLCLAPNAGGPCRQCKACKLVEASTHPDFLAIEPEGTAKLIKVDQIRSLTGFASQTASIGRRRVILLAPAEAMNLNAANAFLKTLEEPGKDTNLLLVTNQLSALLPTIRSRCRIFAFPMPGRERVVPWLEEHCGKEADIDDAMALAGGRPLRAMRLLGTELKQQFALFHETMQKLTENNLSPLDAARELQSLESADVLEWFQYLVYTEIRSATSQEQEGGQLLFRFLDRLAIVRQRLLGTANPNPQLVWEEVLMDWKSVLDFLTRQQSRVS